MAENVFDTSKHYSIPLYGHGFTTFPEANEPKLPGYFAADTVEVDPPSIIPDTALVKQRETEYALFTVDEPQNWEYPYYWAGTYKISMQAIMGGRASYMGIDGGVSDNQPTLADILALYEID